MSYKKVKLNHISLKSLEVGHIYKYPIFYKNKNLFKKLINIDEQYSPDTENVIQTQKITDVYVLSENYDQYEMDTQEYLTMLVNNSSISTLKKFEIVQDMTADAMNNLFQGDVNTKGISRVNILLDDTIDIILHEKSAITAMLDVTSYDYYTYTHCVNVSLYTLGFGAYLNFSKEQLKILMKAAILHDLGKKDVPNEIVNKNGKLNDAEFTIMKSHPTNSVKLLKALGEDNSLLFTIIEQHHEKIDGSGYPYGLKGDDINIYSQILAITDIFDALTTKRSYKDALKSYEALEIMKNNMSNELNENLLKKFIRFLSDKKDKT